MDSSLKQRLVGATVLVALAVIFLPMLVKGPAPDSGVSDVSLDIPVEPKGDSDTRTVDLPLMPAVGAPQDGVVGMPADVRDDGATASTSAGLFPAVAAGDYVVSFGSYANIADADQVIAALVSAELPAYREVVKIEGRDAQRVRIGPFADRAVAESARLRAAHVNDKVGAKVVALDAAADAPAPAKIVAAPAPSKPEPLPPVNKPVTTPLATTTPQQVPAKPIPAKPIPVAPVPVVAKPTVDTSKTGFAVQVGAFTAAADANALRDKLRTAGFNTFTDTVTTDKGVLTRVRVGPAMNRAEADALSVSIKTKTGLSGMVRAHP